MFSSRLQWDVRPNRIAEALAQHAGPVLDLTESNPTRAGLLYPSGLLEPLASTRCYDYDPFPAGAPAAREAVAAAYERRSIDVSAGRIVLTTSTSESYAWLFKLLADPGDELLVPRPSYPLFDFLAALESVRVVQYPLVYHGSWSIDFEALADAASERARAVVVVNPNNPTGSFLKRQERDRLSDFCASRNLAVISDEVFADYAFHPDPEDVPTLIDSGAALTFSLGGLSKMAGLPQMKLGWIVVSGPAALQQQALNRLELIADTYLSVGTPVQNAAPRLLEAGESIQRQIAARVRDNLAWLRTALLAAPACDLLELDGGWYAVLRVPRTRTEEEWTLELLERDGVLVQPGYFYDFESEAFLVLSLLTRREAFEDGVTRLLART